MIVAAAVCAGLAVIAWPAHTPLVRRAAMPRAGGTAPRRPQRRRRGSDLDAVIALLEGIPPALAAGVAPAAAVGNSAALAAARVSRPALRADLMDLAAQAASGADLAVLWARMYRRHGIRALDDVARAWALSEQLGCPLGDALHAATGMLREHVDLQRRIGVAVAGPRATMHLLTLLPVLGVAIAWLIGVSPWRLYAGPLGISVLVLGALFIGSGRWLTTWMIRRACAPAPVS